MKVDNMDPRPAYVQLADDLRVSIRSGRLAPGERLPSGRQLADQFGVAMMTVQKALDVLRREGLVVSQQGRGVFVTAAKPGEPADDLETLRTAVEDLTRRVTDLEERVDSAPRGPARQ